MGLTEYLRNRQPGAVKLPAVLVYSSCFFPGKCPYREQQFFERQLCLTLCVDSPYS